MKSAICYLPACFAGGSGKRIWCGGAGHEYRLPTFRSVDTQLCGWSGIGEHASTAGRVDGGVSRSHVELYEDGSDMVLHGTEREEEPVAISRSSRPPLRVCARSAVWAMNSDTNELLPMPASPRTSTTPPPDRSRPSRRRRNSSSCCGGTRSESYWRHQRFETLTSARLEPGSD